MISKETAGRIWTCHSEIETAKKLLAETEKELGDDEPDYRGRPEQSLDGRRPFELGVPTRTGGHRLYRVAPQLAQSVIRAHIANKEAELVEACEQARIELAKEV